MLDPDEIDFESLFDDMDSNKPTEGMPMPGLTQETIDEIKRALEASDTPLNWHIDWCMWIAREYAIKPQPYYFTGIC